MKKLNNSGFSLIELIIVMAIMAILTVAVAPQYLKYVERSRKAVDVQTMATVITAIDIYAADPVVGGLEDKTETITLVNGGDYTVNTSSTATVIDKALTNAGISVVTLKSKQWVDDSTKGLGLTVTVTNGVPAYSTVNQKAGLDIIKGVTESNATPTAPAEGA